MPTRDEIRRQAIQEAAARVASGEWKLTPHQKALLARTKAEMKADRTRGPDRTRLLNEAIVQALGMLRQAVAAEGVPKGVRALLEEVLDVLARGTGETEMKAARRAVAFITLGVKADRESSDIRRGLLKLTARARKAKLP